MKFTCWTGPFFVVLLQWIHYTSASTQLIVPLLPVAALHAITANLPLIAGAAAVLKGAATTGAYLYLRNKGALDGSLTIEHDLAVAAAKPQAIAAGYGRRGQRQATVVAEPVTQTTRVKVNPGLEKLLRFDKLGCGFRLMCELASLPASQLQHDEKIILALYGSEYESSVAASEGNRRLSFAYASMLGRMSRDPKVCSSVYSRCPHERLLVMDALRATTTA